MYCIDNPIIFYSITLLTILFSVLAISFKNIFYSLLSAIVVFFLAGLIFYILGSEYNAIIQIAIYGVAVPIILGVAIMFTNLRDNKKAEEKKSRLKYLIFLVFGISLLAIIYLFLTSFIVVPIGFNIMEQSQLNTINSVSIFGKEIFSRYVFAFELISVILTIVVVGLTMFKNKEKSVHLMTEERLEE